MDKLKQKKYVELNRMKKNYILRVVGFWANFHWFYVEPVPQESLSNGIYLKNKVRELRAWDWEGGRESAMCSFRFDKVWVTVCYVGLWNWYCISTYSRYLPLVLGFFSSSSCTRRGKFMFHLLKRQRIQHIHCSTYLYNIFLTLLLLKESMK